MQLGKGETFANAESEILSIAEHVNSALTGGAIVGGIGSVAGFARGSWIASHKTDKANSEKLDPKERSFVTRLANETPPASEQRTR